MKLEEYEILRKIASYEAEGLIERAIDKAMEVGMSELAEELCEKKIKEYLDGQVMHTSYGKGLDCAARLADKVGMKSRARELRESQLKSLEKAGERYYEEGADLASELGMTEKAKELYEKSIIYWEKGGHLFDGTERTIEIAIRAGMTEKAREVAEKKIKKDCRREHFSSAACLAKKAGMLEEAIQFYIRGKHFDEAAELAEGIGMTEEARIYKEISDVLRMSPLEFIIKR